jgi:ABC-type Fe3+/spermidine/putrescine transport system ATPase subunit
MTRQEVPYFCARGLQKTWESAKIVFSLDAQKNSMTAIAGPSGSGKSTALNLIAGLTQSEGNPILRLEGKDIARLPPGKRGIGMVFQTPALFWHMRIDDNVAYGLRSRGESKKESRKKASAWLEKIGLGGFEERFPETLSGGEAQRVQLARVLIVEPRLVLFDEPFSALDFSLREKLIKEIAALKAQTGWTGILVTHDITEARALCDRIVHIENGAVMRIENL